MRARRMAGVLAAVLALGVASAAAQDRGKTKAEGRVVNEQGEPLPEAIVAAVMEGFDKPFQQAKTNKRGEWTMENLAEGKWKFYFGGVEGLEEKAVDVALGGSGTVKVPEVKLGKPVDHNAFVNSELQRAAEMMQTRQPSEARKIYEALLVKYPDVPADFQGQLHGAVAQTYAAENNATQALVHLKQAVALDPSNTDIQLVYGEMLIQSGDKAGGEKILLAMDIEQVKDPYPYMNVIIGMINEQKSDEALALLGKLMTKFPNETTLYYYRGRANLAAKDLPAARADLEKFVAGAKPGAPELDDAKKILEQLKDVK